MYHKYHTRGVIIGGKADGDDSKRVSVFTEDFGFINAKIQGARHTRSKLRSCSQELSIGEFSLVHGKSGWKMVSAKSEKNIFELLRSSPLKLKVAVSVLSLTRKLSGEEDHFVLFKIILNFLNFITKAEEKDVPLAECLVLLRVLHSLGYMRYDPDFSVPISSSEIEIKDLEIIAPKRQKMVELINESLKATQIIT